MDDNPTDEHGARPTRSGARLPATRKPSTVVGTGRSSGVGDERMRDSAEQSERRAIVTAAPSALGEVPAPVIEAVRFLIASLQNQEKEAQLPTRLGFTSALAGEGVTFIARTVAAVIAHDLRERVCVIDLNWGTEGPVREDQRSRARGARGAARGPRQPRRRTAL